MKTGNSYKDGFLALAEEYRRILSQEGDVFIERIARESSVREVLVTVYCILKDAGQLVPLEDLEPEEKAELWREAVRILPGADKEVRVQACKALHAMGSYCRIKREETTL
jgi:hypothetical protein